MTAENRRHMVNMATAEAIPPSWLSETCHRKTKETDALDAAAGSEPVLTGVTIGTRMTAGPILTNPGAPDISSEFLEAAGGSDARSFRSTSCSSNATHGRPARIIHDFNAVPREILDGIRVRHVAERVAPGFQHRFLAGPLRRQVGGLVIVLASGPLSGLPHLAHREQPSHARTRFRKLFGERRDIDDIVPETENRHTAPPFQRPVPVYDGSGRFASLSARRNDKCAHLRTQMGWFASLCARTRRFGAHLRTQNGPTRGNVRAHHSAVRRDSADQASKKPD